MKFPSLTHFSHEKKHKTSVILRGSASWEADQRPGTSHFLGTGVVHFVGYCTQNLPKCG